MSFASRFRRALTWWAARRTAGRSSARASQPTSRNPRSELERQLADVEAEAIDIRERAKAESAAAAACEARAMAAVRNRNDQAARDALEQHAIHAEAAAALEYDLSILGAIAETCREALGTAASDRATP